MCDGDLVEGEGLGTCGSINASFLYFGWSRIRFSSFSSKFFFSGEQSFAKFPSKTNHQDQPFPEKIRGVRMTNTLGAPSQQCSLRRSYNRNKADLSTFINLPQTLVLFLGLRAFKTVGSSRRQLLHYGIFKGLKMDSRLHSEMLSKNASSQKRFGILLALKRTSILMIFWCWLVLQRLIS